MINFIFEIVKEDPAIFIAGCALLLTVWQGLQNRKHNRLSVRPLLSSLTSGVPVEGDDEMMRFSFELVNSGVGPAIIKKFVLQLDGKPVVINNAQKYEDFLYEQMKGFTDIKMSYPGPNSVIRKGEKRVLWGFECREKDNMDFFYKLDILIEYRSIYEDKVFTYDASKHRGN